MTGLLCSLDDVAALGATGEPVAVAAMAAAATARFCQQAGSRVLPADHSRVLRVAGGRVRLTQLPVLSVAGVWTLDDAGQAGAAWPGWVFDGIDTLDLTGAASVINAGWGEDPATVLVAWSAGWDPVPEDARWCVAGMVARALTSPAAPGVAGESIGEYSWRGGAWTASGAMSMTPDEVAVAARYRPRRNSLPVTAG